MVLTAFRVSGQQANDASEFQRILSRINEDNFVSADTIGMFGPLPNDHPLKRLCNAVPKEQLIHLTNDSNTKVHCTAFKALTMVDEPSAFHILKQHLNDTAMVNSKYGCFGAREFAGDYFVNVFTGHDAVKSDPSHLKELDSLILFTSNKLEARDGAVRRAGAKRKYYERVRELAITEKFFGAAVALALFKQDADVDIITRAMVGGTPHENRTRSAAIIVASNFTHPAFMPVLEKGLNEIRLEKEYQRSALLFTAISKYENEKSRELLMSVFDIKDKEKRREQLKDLSLALSKNTNPLYSNIRKRLAVEMRN
jgi:hypothetical protein